jgi:membrane-bound ClpP family serine protease
MRFLSSFMLAFASLAKCVRGSAPNTSAFVISSRGATEAAVHNIGSSATKRKFASTAAAMVVDPDYPGTAVERMMNVRERVSQLSNEDLNGTWEEVRRKILWAG